MRWYLTGVVVSGFGTTAMWLVSGIWVKSLTGSDGLAALTAFALWAPALLGPLLGTLADRVRRRPLLIALDLAMVAVLPLLLWVTSADRVWLLFAVLVLYGTQGAVHDAAEQALLSTGFDKERLGSVNGWRMTANESMKLIAPLAAAGLFARYGGGPVALLDAASFALAAGAFAAMRVREERPVPAAREPGAGGRSWWRETAEGVRLLAASPVLRPLVATGSFTMLLAGVNGAAVYAVVDGLGRPAAYAGVLYAVQGAGSVLAGLTTGPLLRRVPERLLAAAGLALFAAAAGVRAVPHEAAALAASAVIGLGMPWVLVATMTAVQREAPAEAAGRLAATANTALFVPNALALALGAGLVTTMDVRLLLPALAVAGLAWALRAATAPERVAVA
ncbi:MFS transporter [Streptomyces sp. R302]|uniref:MFS transporter n=1 Tax=unclassified Streptomyces TaxID=2593676 RepID=UPI00145F67EE|nr:MULTISPECIES: MFS transporter [unclassified Streptomyces]NML49803.1 MFS transporter [Streptomyces sp. R301]NML78130.1 MFS transporter [Streptomyces sp. R302]